MGREKRSGVDTVGIETHIATSLHAKWKKATTPPNPSGAQVLRDFIQNYVKSYKPIKAARKKKK